jgi:DNA-binding HxlR family transcriptional regulator
VTESTKIDFRYRRVSQMGDVTDLVAVLFPSNRNQQHAAARILLTLRDTGDLRNTLSDLQQRYGISRRTLERTRAKLVRLGIIERVSWMNTRYGGREGWKLSSRMSSSLRQLADRLDAWRQESRPEQRQKDNLLVNVLNP